MASSNCTMKTTIQLRPRLLDISPPWCQPIVVEKVCFDAGRHELYTHTTEKVKKSTRVGWRVSSEILKFWPGKTKRLPQLNASMSATTTTTLWPRPGYCWIAIMADNALVSWSLASLRLCTVYAAARHRCVLTGIGGSTYIFVDRIIRPQKMCKCRVFLGVQGPVCQYCTNTMRYR